MPRVNKRNKKLSTKLSSPLQKVAKRLKLNNTIHTKTAPVNMAHIILQNVSNVWLYVELDEITSGDGNCFYHAVIQQFHRPEVDRYLAHDYHELLRRSVYTFVHEGESSIAYIQEYKKFYQSVLSGDFDNMSWETFVQQQSRIATYATELFIKASAVYIGLDVLITSENCTEEQPYAKVIRTWNDNGPNDSPSILIGNISGVHFQSLLPLQQHIDVQVHQLIMQHFLTANI